jgi:hypothetical protein
MPCKMTGCYLFISNRRLQSIDYINTVRKLSNLTSFLRDTRQRSRLSHYATSRRVAVSSPDEVDFFSLANHSSRTMALESTEPLTEMSTCNLFGGRRVRADNLTAICKPIV